MADIDEIVHGERREGIFVGVNTLFSRAATGIEAFAIGLGLAAFGYTKGTTEQSEFTQFGIMLIAVVVPLVFLGIGWLAAMRLKLNKENPTCAVGEHCETKTLKFAGLLMAIG